jgi:hypothetical protein
MMSAPTELRGFACGVIGVAVLLVMAPSPNARASEAKGDLNIELRLIDTVPAIAVARTVPTGVAKIEVVVDAFRGAHGVQLSVERPDGSPWTFNGRPASFQPVAWTAVSGEPEEPGGDGMTLPPQGVIRTTIEVPLGGAAVHEIIVRVRGFVGDDPVTTEAIVKAPLGVAPSVPVDDGTHINVAVQAVN